MADVKLENVFVNQKEHNNDGIRFSDIQLGDFGGTSPATSKWAKEGTPVGTPLLSSPEVIMETPWNTARDIWAFGAALIGLIYGGNFNVFRPKTVPYGHEEYGLEVLKQQFRFFGPFPGKYDELAAPMTVHTILYLMQEIPKPQTTPFHRMTEGEVCKKDKEFIGKIMMMDWRDRPTARQLLEDEWFGEEGLE